MTRATKPDTISVDDFAAAIGVNEKLLRQCIRNGDAPGYKLGARIVIPREAFERFMRGEWKPEHRPLIVVAKQEEVGECY